MSSEHIQPPPDPWRPSPDGGPDRAAPAANVQNQLEKWRSQERFFKILIRSILGILAAAALVVLVYFLVNWLRPLPRLKPADLADHYSDYRGKAVLLTGRVSMVDPTFIRVNDDLDNSIYCDFAQVPDHVKVNDTVTVQGTVSVHGLTHCKLIGD